MLLIYNEQIYLKSFIKVINPYQPNSAYFKLNSRIDCNYIVIFDDIQFVSTLILNYIKYCTNNNSLGSSILLTRNFKILYSFNSRLVFKFCNFADNIHIQKLEVFKYVFKKASVLNIHTIIDYRRVTFLFNFYKSGLKLYYQENKNQGKSIWIKSINLLSKIRINYSYTHNSFYRISILNLYVSMIFNTRRIVNFIVFLFCFILGTNIGFSLDLQNIRLLTKISWRS